MAAGLCLGFGWTPRGPQAAWAQVSLVPLQRGAAPHGANPIRGSIFQDGESPAPAPPIPAGTGVDKADGIPIVPLGQPLPAGLATGPFEIPADTTSGTDRGPWAAWWDLNRAGLLDLRTRVRTQGVTTGSADYFLGLGEVPSPPVDLDRAHGPWVTEQVLPVLLGSLDSEGGPQVSIEALLALGRISPALAREDRAQVRAALEEHLASPNRAIAEAAVTALGMLPGTDAVATLAALVRGEEAGQALVSSGRVPERMRAMAAIGLGLAARDAGREDVRRFAVHVLCEALERAGRGPSDLAGSAILALGLVPLERIGVRDPGGVPEPPSTSRVALGRHLAGILAQERLSRQDVRSQVPVALAGLGRDAPLDRAEELATWLSEPLLERVGRPRRDGPDGARAIALSLGWLTDSDGDSGDRRAREVLIGLLDDADQSVRQFALLSLGRVAARPGKGANPGLARDELARALERQLERGRSTARPFAATGLALLVRELRERGEAVPDGWIEALRGGLRQARSPQELMATSIAAGLTGDARLFPELVAAFRRAPEGEVRAQVAVGLGLLGLRDALPVLHEWESSVRQRPAEQRALAEALVLAGDLTYADKLVRRLEGTNNSAEQIALLAALAEVGDERAGAPLLALARPEGASGQVRAAALRALGRIGDPRPLPWGQPLAELLQPLGAPSAVYRPATAEQAASPAPHSLKGLGLLNVLP